MQRAACGPCPRGGALFYDFSAAFPSLAHTFPWAVLRESGMPEFVVQSIMAFCEGNQHWFPWNAGAGSALTVRSGGKHGYPHSPIVFSLCTAPIMELLSEVLTNEELQALFADGLCRRLSLRWQWALAFV